MSEGQSRHDRDEGKRREALQDLDRLRHEGDSIGSTLTRAAQRTADHFTARDAIGSDGAVDPAELWGRRIGRALSVAAVIGLSIYLYVTYLR